MNEFEELFKEEIRELKRELMEEAAQKVERQTPKDTNFLSESQSFEWEGDDMYAINTAEYAEFVRLGYITRLGNRVEGRNYLDFDFDFEQENS